ncbi:hypothetical protein BD289DRAFT_376548 [Coniella lustricola]|uniref:Inositol monophosphatase n=1 Tax=Coniella lustricola TaxID=2025994 RepID=A0A2T2ZWQ2_9PEZI|nr:hypothetical protein BD289DRAFT_376548 [Coniella lustricola]
MDSPYTRELQVAIAAVSAAARLSTLVLTHASGLGTVAKDDLSPVTVGDFAIQALLTSTIHAAFPQDRFVGEESADALRENPALLDRVWAVLRAIEEQLAQERSMHHDSDKKYNHLVTFPTSPAQMCQMLDWCGQGTPSASSDDDDDDDDDATDSNSRIWVFDPIDGTENFVKGLLYAINVAMLCRQDTDTGPGAAGAISQVLSVVGCPNMAGNISFPASDDSLDPSGCGCLLYGVRGHGAYERRPLLPAGYDGTAASLQQTYPPSELPWLSSLMNTTTSTTPISNPIPPSVLAPSYPGSVLLPWVLRWVLLALGVGNATWWIYKSRSRLAKIWDHAGAMLLFEEVGGQVSDADGKPINWAAGRQMVDNWGIVAAPRAEGVFDRVIGTVKQVVREKRPDLVEGREE